MTKAHEVKVGVVGLGVVGGAVAEGFRRAGADVTGYDRYKAIGSCAELADREVIFVCVPTPSTDDGLHDLTEIWAAVAEIDQHVGEGTVVAIKSTVPPGTSRSLASAYQRLRVASVPEFLVAARPLETFTAPDRVLIGADSPEAGALLSDVMRIAAPSAPILILRPDEAELAKLCSNAMLAAKVTIANELAEIAAHVDVEWTRIQSAIGLDPRIGAGHLTVVEERGFGGHCLPKDVDGLIATSRRAGYLAPLLAHVADFNREIRGQHGDASSGAVHASSGGSAS